MFCHNNIEHTHTSYSQCIPETFAPVTDRLLDTRFAKKTINGFMYTLKGDMVIKEGAELAIEKCPIRAEFEGQNITIF